MAGRHFAAILIGTALLIGTSSFSLDGGDPSERQAQAEPTSKRRDSRISRCVRYKQSMGDDKQSVDISLRNGCQVALSCSVEWTLRCEGSSDDTESANTLALGKGVLEIVNASAASCGDAAWMVDDIKWECEPL